MRSRFQHQAEVASYVFAGSEPGIDAQAAVKRLTATVDVEPEGRRQRVVDPLFRAWIRQMDRVDADGLDTSVGGE